MGAGYSRCLVDSSVQNRGELEHRIKILTDDLTGGLGKVARRFVQDMLVGMELAHSPRLSDIASVLDEEIGPRATHKRLSRNAARKEIAAEISRNLLKLSAARVKDDTLLFLDWPNLLKNRAEKMENLAPISNTKGDAIGKGYHLAKLVASEVDSHIVTPLVQDIWTEINSNTDFNSYTLGLVAKVREATDGRGILVADRGADRAELLTTWTEDLDSRFIIRVRQHTGLKYRNQIVSAGELASRCDTPYGRNVENVVPVGFRYELNPAGWEIVHDAQGQGLNTLNPTQFIHFGYLPVRLSDVPDRPLSIIAIRGVGAAPIILLTTEPARSNRAVLTALVESYLRHWRVKLTTQHFYNRHRFSKIRVLSYDRIRNLATLGFALEYLHSLRGEERGTAPLDDIHLLDAGINLYKPVGDS